jgi:hypothetical protein
MHALSAGGWILGAEMLDMWRNEKRLAFAMREAQQPRLLAALFDGPGNVEQGRRVSAEVLLVNELEPVADQPLTVLARGPQGERRQVLVPRASAPSGVTPLWKGELNVGSAPGKVEMTFVLGCEDRPLAVGRRSVWVISKVKAEAPLRVCMLGDSSKDAAAPILTEMGLRVETQPEKADRIVYLPPFAPASKDAPWGPMGWASDGKRVLVLASHLQALHSACQALRLEGHPKGSVGSWSPVAHGFLDRRLVRALPEDRILGQAYASVLPRVCLTGRFPPRTAALCLSYQPEDIGGLPLDFWCGSTLFHYSIGRGLVTICTFRLMENMAADPIARQLLLNLLCFDGEG